MTLCHGLITARSRRVKKNYNFMYPVVLLSLYFLLQDIGRPAGLVSSLLPLLRLLEDRDLFKVIHTPF